MLERGEMLQAPLINDGVAMSCKRLQWRTQGQERALPIEQFTRVRYVGCGPGRGEWDRF